MKDLCYLGQMSYFIYFEEKGVLEFHDSSVVALKDNCTSLRCEASKCCGHGAYGGFDTPENVNSKYSLASSRRSGIK